jgi:predicted glycoside hydrolase/deacetylase ChbG (UPF0249 family)
LGDDGGPFDFGVHLNLTQGRPLTGHRYPSRLLDRCGRFPGIGGLLIRMRYLRDDQRRAVRAELAAQVDRVLATGLPVTHLNGHQYIELIPGISELVFELAATHDIRSVRLAAEPGLWRSLRVSAAGPAGYLGAGLKHYLSGRFAPAFKNTGLSHCAAFFGTVHAGRIDLRVFAQYLRTMDAMKSAAKPRPPFSAEIAFHPAEPATFLGIDEDGWSDPLRQLRPREQELLISPWLRDALLSHHIRLARLDPRTLSRRSNKTHCGKSGLEMKPAKCVRGG